MKIAIVALSRGGLELARRLQPSLDGAVVHGLAGRADGADLPFADTIGHLRACSPRAPPLSASAPPAS